MGDEKTIGCVTERVLLDTLDALTRLPLCLTLMLAAPNRSEQWRKIIGGGLIELSEVFPLRCRCFIEGGEPRA
jgi:hypothetical protein